MFDEDADRDKIDLNKDVQLVVCFLIPRKRLEPAINRAGALDNYMVLPTRYPERNNTFGEYSWFVLFCPKDIKTMEEYQVWCREVKCDPYIYSEPFHYTPDKDKFIYDRNHDAYYVSEYKFNSKDETSIIDKISSLRNSGDWHTLELSAWLNLRNAEVWLNEETGGVENTDKFNFDYAAFPLEVALDAISEELNAAFFIPNND